MRRMRRGGPVARGSRQRAAEEDQRIGRDVAHPRKHDNPERDFRGKGVRHQDQEGDSRTPSPPGAPGRRNPTIQASEYAPVSRAISLGPMWVIAAAMHVTPAPFKSWIAT